jgi:hypothetical protein
MRKIKDSLDKGVIMGFVVGTLFGSIATFIIIFKLAN